jgi:hypothetical protein
MIRRWLLVLALAPVSTTCANEPIVLENEFLRVEFSATDGSITRLTNKVTSLELISRVPQHAQPWALLLAPFEFVVDFQNFIASAEATGEAQTAQLRWETSQRIVINARARLATGSDQLELRCSAENFGDRTILAFRYPALQGIGTLSPTGAQDRLLHSTLMGAVFTDPFHLFCGGAPTAAGRGLVVSRYPNGFHGSSLQLMAYYVQGRGGFYFASQDSELGDKDLNFYKAADDGSLECEFAHIQSDARAGKSLMVRYPVVIAALTEGTWYEAAERYRAWATDQPWCRRGTRRQRMAAGDGCPWLHEQIGAVGMWWPFRGDIRQDVERTRRFYGAPLLHLELWWSHERSHAAARSDGDRFGPFYFPFLALQGQAEFAANRADAIIPRATPIASDWIAMCPAQPIWRKVVCESAEDQVGTQPLRHHQIWIDENKVGCQADCLYYDIGPCAGVPTHCYAPNHVHAPGAGGDITRAYVSLFGESQQRASQARGTYVPIGTECVSEPFVSCLDLYYPRTAGMSLDMETFPYVRDLTWLPDGLMHIVPLFEFIYHEYGPLAAQGIYPVSPWGVSGAEDFLTWAEARAVLWGGLFVSFPVPESPRPSDQRTRFLRSLVSARTGFARDLLAYGRMQQPPTVDCGTIEIDHGLGENGWLRNVRCGGLEAAIGAPLLPPQEATHDDTHAHAVSVEQWAKSVLDVPITAARTRTMEVPSVLCQAYTLDGQCLGILLVNLRADHDEVVQVPVEPSQYGLPEGVYDLHRLSMTDHCRIASDPEQRTIEVTLPPRELILVTARPRE